MKLRGFEEHDINAMAEIVASSMSGMQPNAEMLRGGFRALENEGARCGHVVAETDGRVIAWGTYMNRPSVHPAGVFEVQLHTHAGDAGARATATSLGHHLLSELGAIGAQRAQCRIPSTADGSVFSALGFVETHRHHELQLELASFEPREAQERARALAEAGIALETYDALERDPQRSRKLYELMSAVHRDIPGAVSVLPATIADFEARVLANPALLRSISCAAVEGDRYVGFTEVTRSYIPGSAFVTLTGTLREVRGKGVATALKLAAAAAAKAAGLTSMFTVNHVDNTRISAINEALGFQRKTTWVTLGRAVRE